MKAKSLSSRFLTSLLATGAFALLATSAKVQAQTFPADSNFYWQAASGTYNPSSGDWSNFWFNGTTDTMDPAGNDVVFGFPGTPSSATIVLDPTSTTGAAEQYTVEGGTFTFDMNGSTATVWNGATWVFGSGTGNAAVVNFTDGAYAFGGITVGANGSSNNIVNGPNGTVTFSSSATFSVSGPIIVGATTGGGNNALYINSGETFNASAITVNVGATATGNNLLDVNGGTILGKTAATALKTVGPGNATTSGDSQVVVENGGLISVVSLPSIAAGTSITVKGQNSQLITNASTAITTTVLGNIFVQDGGSISLTSSVDGKMTLGTNSLISVDGANSRFSFATPNNSGTAVAINTGSNGAEISVTHGGTFTSTDPLMLSGATAHFTINVDSESTFIMGAEPIGGKQSGGSSLGGLTTNAQELVITGGGTANFEDNFSMLTGAAAGQGQVAGKVLVDATQGALEVNELGQVQVNVTSYIPVIGTLIVGTGGFNVFSKVGSNATGFLHVGSGLNLQLAGGTYDLVSTASGGQAGTGDLYVETGGTVSGFGSIWSTHPTISTTALQMNGGTLRVGDSSQTAGSLMRIQSLSTTAASTFNFTVYGFGGPGGVNTSNYDQITLGSALQTNGLTNTINISLNVNHDTLMGFEPGANGDSFQFFGMDGTTPGSAQAAVNVGSFNINFGTSQAQLESVGLAWDTSNFATTGLMGFKEVAWMQLNNSAPIDNGTALTVLNGIRSVNDGFSGNGVDGTLTSQTVQGTGWSVQGGAANGTPITAGSTVTTGTAVFTAGSNTTLNGNYTGSITASFDLGNSTSGSQMWQLNHVISGLVADSGQAGIITGQSYAGFNLTSTRGTTATMLAGTASGNTLLGMNFRSSTVSYPYLKSDILTLSGVNATGSMGFHGSTLTDLYVLQMSYTPDNNAPYYVAWFDASADNGQGEWVNAISGDSNSTGDVEDGKNAIVGTYAGQDTLGQYGYDPTTDTAWVVVDHESDFAVIPEPSTYAMIALGFGVLGVFRRLRGSGRYGRPANRGTAV